MLFNLSKEMREKGFTCTTLAEKVGVSRHTINNWIKENTYPPIDKALIIQECFDNKSLDYLFGEAFEKIRGRKK